MNDETTPDTPTFDLFATEVEDNLKEELAKGTFQWTNKYTKMLGIAFVIVGLLSIGTWYGHYEATKTTTTSSSRLSSLRAAFGAGGGFSGFGGFGSGRTGTSSTTTGSAATAATAAGGFAGFGGTRITGIIKSVKGSTVTITLDDPTQASSLISGDVARVTDTGAAATGAAPAAPATGTTSNSATAGTTSGSTTSSAPAPTSTARPRGGAFSNPKLTACLKKAGITFTAGTRPNFQDPKTAAAIQSCFSQLGITPGGGFGGGATGGAAPTPAATK